MHLRHFILLSFCLSYTAAQSCSLKPILQGINVAQELGSSRKKIYKNIADCKAQCDQETDFECKAVLWPGITGDCYLLDKVDLTRQLFRDNRPFILYVSVCSGEITPSVGFCEFRMIQDSVEASSVVPTVSPGATTESSCTEFCISEYRGKKCQSFVVSQDRASTCTLFESTPADLGAGSQRLWNKTCMAPPKNCEYTQWSTWSECSASCGGGKWTHRRSVSIEGDPNGVQCLDSELTESLDCNTQECGGAHKPTDDCEYGPWSKWTNCAAPTNCGKGTQIRERNVTKSANGGKSCSSEDQADMKVCETGINCTPTCIYSSWSTWSTCGANCMESRSRTIELGDASACEVEYGPLTMEQVCEGGSCKGSSGGTATIKPDGELSEEKGCKYTNVDPSSRPSSKGFKAVGAVFDCALKCKEEKSFTCEAYVTTGPHGPCLLHGAIDRQTTVLKLSKYYLQDVNCNANKSADTSLCGWQKTGMIPSPESLAAEEFKGIGFALNADHCGTLCMMNHPMFKPNPCSAYAFNPAIKMEMSGDNCYFFQPPLTLNQTGGAIDMYQLVCSI